MPKGVRRYPPKPMFLGEPVQPSIELIGISKSPVIRAEYIIVVDILSAFPFVTPLKNILTMLNLFAVFFQQIADSIGNRYFTSRAAFCAGYNVIPYPYIVLACGRVERKG